MNVLIGPNKFGLETVLDELRPLYPDIAFEYCPDNGDLGSKLSAAEVYMGWLTRDVYLGAENIEWIQSPSSGVDKFLAIPELKQDKVLLTSAAGTHGNVLADHAMGMILTFTRGFHILQQKQRERVWHAEIRARCRELRGLTMGIVGFGHVGQQVANRANAFGMTILAMDVDEKPRPDFVKSLGTLGDLNDIVSQSDIVVVTAPYTETTRGFIGKKQFELMKHDALLIGISRGGVIDEIDLLEALQQRQIGGAALDVFEEEPLPGDSPLWTQENLILTPHSAGGTQYEAENINGIFKENLAKYLAGDLPLVNQVNKDRGW